MIINTIIILLFIYINKYYEIFIESSKNMSNRTLSLIKNKYSNPFATTNNNSNNFSSNFVTNNSRQV